MENTRQTGARKEKNAADYLVSIGYEILSMNFKSRFGEIDIVAREGKYLVFIEVKYRSNHNCGYPEDAVNTAKQKRIYKTAAYYLYSNRLDVGQLCRFDVVLVEEGRMEVIQNAFGGL